MNVVPDPKLLLEYEGLAVGDEVTVTNCHGRYAKVNGPWKFQNARVDDNGNVIEFTVHGGKRKMTRTFPIDRLEIPKKKLTRARK